MEPDRSRLDGYMIIKTLGKGATSKVKLAKNCLTGQMVALKIIRPGKAYVFGTELDVLKRVSEHPNIIKLISYSNSSIYLRKSGRTKLVTYMALELGENGEIFDYISKLGAFPDKIARKCFSELISGIAALHSAGVVHRDLKPENIYFSEKFQLKLADFGFCAPSEGRTSTGHLNSFKGTRAYMAPEVLERKPYKGIPTDIFSAGIILFIFVFGRPPFMRAERINPHFINIVNKNWERFWKIHNNIASQVVPDHLKDLLEKMLAYDPEERISMSEILEHPWITGEISDEDEVIRFLSKALVVDEVCVDESSLNGEEGKEYRSMWTDDELHLSRGSSRNIVAVENLTQKTTKFAVGNKIDEVFEKILVFFSDKAKVKEKFAAFELKIDMDEFEARVSVGRANDRYIVELQRICGDQWKFYETYQELLKFLTEV